MPFSQLSHVRKRDGRLVPFEPANLTQSILAAARACNITENLYAQEIADAVALHLSKTCDSAPPSTSEIADAVELILITTKSEEVARAYRVFRFEREEGRARCTVWKPFQPSLFNADVAVQVTFSHGQRATAWDRTRIVRALEREARIPRTAAEDIARSVEAKILSSDVRRVTTTLIRALTDNELLARGYTSALRQHSSVTVPFSDLEQLLDTGKPADLALELGRQVVQPYALTHIYSDDVAMAHRRGLFHIDGLSHPFSLYNERVDLNTQDASPREFRSAWRRCLHRLETGLSVRTTIPLGSTQLSPAFSSQLGECCDYASTLDGVARVTFSCAAELAESFAEVFGAMVPAPSIRLSIRGGASDKAVLLNCIAGLVERGWSVGRQANSCDTPLSQRITVNLPQAVYRARQRDLDGVIEELYRSIDLAAQAHRQYCMYAREHGRALPEGHAACIDVAGFAEAVAVLSGAGVFESDESLACMRVLLCVLQNGLRQAAECYGLRVLLLVGEPDACGKRLATIDQSLFPELFGYLPLQPENLEAVIPPYKPLQLDCPDYESTETFARTAATIFGYFGEGVIPLRMPGMSMSDMKEVLGRFVDSACGFLVTGDADPGSASESRDDGQPGIEGLE